MKNICILIPAYNPNESLITLVKGLKEKLKECPIIVVNDGKILFDDTPKQVFQHYKELESVGLAAPQVTYVVKALKEKGWDIDTTATTVEEAKEAILLAIKKREKIC